MLHLDHFFILSSPLAPEADALLNIGLIEGAPNEHAGQGTSNRRFFLENTALEFLYVRDIGEAMNGAGRGLRLVERAIDIDASPFGLITRWKDDTALPDFPYWDYQPDYFPDATSFCVGNNSDNFDEPLCICMPPALPMPKKAPEPNNSGWSLTELQLSVPGSTASEALDRFAKCDLVTLRYSEEHRLNIVLNNATTGESLSCMPDLPVTIEW